MRLILLHIRSLRMTAIRQIPDSCLNGSRSFARLSSFMGARCGVCAIHFLLAAMAVGGESQIRFQDVTDSSGVRFVHTDGHSGRKYIVETVASGLGLIDYDGDDYPDILFLNGTPLPGCAKPNPIPTCELYRNNLNGTFTDVTASTGVGAPIYAMGCAVADYDNDGHDDIFISGYGSHRLLHNNGHGAFTDVTAQAGLANAISSTNCIGAGCAFLDYDRDGFADLFIGHYLEFDIATAEPCRRSNVPVYCSPRVYPAMPNRLYHNNGNGTFSDVSDRSGIGRHKGYAMGIVCSDFDGDGWTDIYAGNDVIENFLFRNKQDGTFEDVGMVSGSAYDQYGDPQGTMGANAGDYDGDGRFDIIVTDYQDQVNTLYRNLGIQHGMLQFKDVTVETGVGAGSRPLVTWGCGLVDFDNDGVPELFTAAGHLQDTVESYDKNSTYKQRSILLRQRQGRFIDITSEAGGGLAEPQVSRGAVFGDLNNDGRTDIVVLNARARPKILLNTTQTTNHWVRLKLVGSKSNRSAVGTVARVTAGGRTWVDEVRAGRGYQSAEDLRLHFGLGAHSMIDRLQIRWASGSEEVRTNLVADRVIRVTEGEP